MAYTRFKADKDIMDALVHHRKKSGAGGSNRWRATLLATLPESRLAIAREAEEDNGRNRGRVRSVWSRHIGGQD